MILFANGLAGVLWCIVLRCDFACVKSASVKSIDRALCVLKHFTLMQNIILLLAVYFQQFSHYGICDGAIAGAHHWIHYHALFV